MIVENKNISTYDITTHDNLNHDLLEKIDKIWIKSTATTKEQKEKQVFDIFHLFLDKLNNYMTKNENLNVSDLILDKSIYISNLTGISDWPSIESLKVTNLHRLSLSIYNYLRYRFILMNLSEGQLSKNKHLKDTPLKAFETICKVVEDLVQDCPIKLTQETIYFIFNDFFEFYLKGRSLSQSNDNRIRVQEDMIAVSDLIKEETSK
jgi:hypothetical protein